MHVRWILFEFIPEYYIIEQLQLYAYPLARFTSRLYTYPNLDKSPWIYILFILCIALSLLLLPKMQKG